MVEPPLNVARNAQHTFHKEVTAARGRFRTSSHRTATVCRFGGLEGSRMRVVGIDGTKGGWVAIVLDDGRFVADLVIRPVKASFEEVSDARVVAVDIPIGYGPRDADAAARAFLTGAASTVFTTPRREMLEVPFGTRASACRRRHTPSAPASST